MGIKVNWKPVIAFTTMTGFFMFVFVNLGHSQSVTACEGETQRDMNECTHQAYEKADATLNRLWKKIQSSFDGSDYDNRTKKALLKSQRAWIAFRDAECEDLLAALQGGTGYSQFYAQCMERMTRERIESLEDRFVEG